MKYLILLSLCFLTSCTTALNNEAKEIIIVKNYDSVKNMKKLGITEGSSSRTGIQVKSGRKNALNEALNKAADLGASHYYIQEHWGHYMSWSVGVRGIAYKDK